MEFPLYSDLVSLQSNTDALNDSDLKNRLESLMEVDFKGIPGKHLVQLIILHHSLINKNSKIWGRNKCITPYGAVVSPGNIGIKYILDNLPQDLKVVLWKFTEFTLN